VDEVLAPDFVLSFHKRTLENMQTDGSPFHALVSLSTLRTRVDKVATTAYSEIEPPVMDDIIIERPSASSSEETQPPDNGSEESDDAIEQDTAEENVTLNNIQEYSQPASTNTRPS